MIDDKLKKEVSFLTNSIQAGQQINFKRSNESTLNKLKKNVKFRDSIAPTKRNTLQFEDDNEFEDDLNEKNVNSETTSINESSSTKRAINYQIEKNKGLTPKRDKTYRNPRVRNRMKARKATIKRKSIVPKLRTQEKRYSGEATGIRSAVVRAVKIK